MKSNNPTIVIKNNTTVSLPVALFKNPAAPDNFVNAGNKYSWNVCSFLFLQLTTVQVQARFGDSGSFEQFTADIAAQSISGVLNALNSLGIGYFYQEEIDGETNISVNSDSYEYSELNINDNSADTSTTVGFEFVFIVEDPGFTFDLNIDGSSPPGYPTFNQISQIQISSVLNGRGAEMEFVAGFTDSHTGVMTLYKNGCIIEQTSFDGNSVSFTTTYDRNIDIFSVIINVNT